MANGEMRNDWDGKGMSAERPAQCSIWTAGFQALIAYPGPTPTVDLLQTSAQRAEAR